MIPFQPCLHYECSNRNNAGYCKSTICINPKYNGSTNTVVGYIETKPKTNADRIRNMSDEELASWLNDPSPCPWCEDATICVMLGDEEVDCEKCILAWLKQEVEE